MEVSCSDGNPYLYFSNGEFYFFYGGNAKKTTAQPNTKVNEYECTFGKDYGFLKGKEYTVRAKYLLNYKNVFEIEGKRYIKFVIYSGNNHYPLTINKSLFIEGLAEYKKDYFPSENVIVYVPLNEIDYSKNFFYLREFEYYKPQNKNPVFLISLLLPSFSF